MSGAPKRTFEYKDDKSSKFWEITQSDGTVTVRYGKIGVEGQTQVKVFSDANAAVKHVEKLIAEKTAKGYSEDGVGLTGKQSAVTEAKKKDPISATDGPTKHAEAVKTIKAAISITPLQDPETTPERLMALVDKDDATNRLLAKHPRASGELLEKLSHRSDKATRQAVTANPNTPPAVCVRLGQQFPKEFLANPALDLLLLVNPALMEEVPEALLVRLLQQESCPTSLLIWASVNSSKKVQLAVAMNPRTPADAIYKLKESQYSDVVRALPSNQKNVWPVESEGIFQKELCNRIGSLFISEAQEAWKKKDIGLPQYHLLPTLVQHSIAGADILTVLSAGNIPVDILEILSKSEDIDVLAAVAKNPNTSCSALELIGSCARDWQTVFAITANPKTPSYILLNLANKSSSIKWRIANNPSLSFDEHKLFSTNSDNQVRCSYAQNILLSSTKLEVLSKSMDPWIRFGVAMNPNTHQSTLKELAKDKLNWEYLARNPSTDTETLALIASDPPAHRLFLIANHPNASSAILTEIIRTADLSDRNVAVRNPNLESAELKGLLGKVDNNLLALNISTPVDVLEILADIRLDPPFYFLSRNPKLPITLFSKLSTSKDESVRGGVASNPSCPLSLLESLSKDHSPYVRWRVLANPNASDSIRKSLGHSLISDDLTSSYWYIQKVKSANEEIKSAVTNRNIYCYTGRDPNSRALSTLPVAKLMAISSGPYILPARLAKQSVSTDWLIRAAVARNTATPSNLLYKLMKDAHPVVAALAKNNIELVLPSRTSIPFPIHHLSKKMAVNKDQASACKVSEISTPLNQYKDMNVKDSGVIDSSEKASLDGIIIGCKVHHTKFGKGVVLNREVWEDEARVLVKFTSARIKWLLLSVAKLTVIE